MKAWPVILSAGLLLAGCGKQADETPAPQTSTSAVHTAAPQQSPSATKTAEPTAKMGEMLFRRCMACHTVEAGGSDGIGPNLHGVVGRAIGSKQGFRYSGALKNHGGVWDEAMLDTFIEQPMKAIPGSRMAFAGVIEPADRQALILYLKESSQ